MPATKTPKKKNGTTVTVHGDIRKQIDSGETVILGLLVYKPKKDILRVEIANSHIETELATAIMAKFGMHCVEDT
jgi:hypothetical protein